MHSSVNNMSYTNLSELNKNQSVTTCITKTKDDSTTLEEVTKLKEVQKTEPHFSYKNIKWLVVIWFSVVHLVSLYGFLTFPYIERYKTFLWAMFVAVYSMIGVTGGVHRLWTHKSFKAKLPLRAILAFCYLSAIQVPIRTWVILHRLHHKFSETDADPHNSKRGFFYSHIGWLMLHRHPEVSKNSRQIDMSDVKNDPVAAFADKHFVLLITAVTFISIAVPVYCWNELWYYATMAQILRYTCGINATFTVNSLAHMWGNKPFDSISRKSFTSYLTLAEGWHNYHHTFPWDYRTSEIAGFRFDVTAQVINFFEKIGWAYDLKRPSESLIKMTIIKRGDGTIPKAAIS